jgi:hypothetical protein
MRVTLTTGGGQLPGANRPRSIDVEKLGEADRAEFARLLAAARGEGAGASAGGAAGARDAKSYTVTFDDGGGPTVLRGNDVNMSRAFEGLLDWIQRHG